MNEASRPMGADDVAPGAWAEWAAAALTVVGALIWFLSRLSPGVAFSIWQGPLLSDASPYHLPLLSVWTVPFANGLEVGNPAWRLNVLSAVFASLALGAFAAMVARAGRTLATPIEGAAAGLVAAGIVATTPALTYAATAAGPAPLTYFLAMAAVALLALRRDARRPFDLILLASLMAGLAAANHPAFAWLLLFVLSAFAVHPVSRRPLGGMVVVAAVFLAAAALPAAVAAARGESLSRFLSHALLTPYPTIGDGRPHWDYGRALLSDLSPLTLILAVPALLLLFRPGTRGYVGLLALLFAVLGPFLPLLTNQTSGAAVLRDEVAPRVMALSAVAAFSALGLLLLVRHTPTAASSRPRRLVLLLAVTSVVLTLHAQRAPDRRHHRADELAHEIYEGCPDGAWLVCGDDGLASLATAYPRTHGLDRKVRIIPASFLGEPRLRLRLTQLLPDASIRPAFPIESDLERWRVERPQLLRELSDAPEGLTPDNPQLQALALWDLVRDNPTRWPLCFVGVSTPWLTARAQLSGVVFCYPRRADPAPSALRDTVERLCAGEEYRSDPDFGETLARLMLPISDLIRDQGDAEEAQLLVQSLAAIDPAAPGPPLGLARAAARLGNREEAARYAEAYALAAQADNGSQRRLLHTIESDFRSAALAQQFLDVIAIGMSGVRNDEARERLSRRLWDEDEVFVLARGFHALVRHNPTDVDALVQAGAAYAQLGDLPEALELLRKAAELNPIHTYELLQVDPGRFALLKVQHELRAAAASDAGE